MTENEVTKKSIWASRTVWLNIIVFLVMIGQVAANTFFGGSFAIEGISTFEGSFTAAYALIAFFLRLDTKTAVGKS